MFTFLGFILLIIAYVISDFSLINVYENSHSTKPLLYKVSGVWGNHEGSMLLWILIIFLATFLIKQHYILDSIFGFAIALPACYVYCKKF